MAHRAPAARFDEGAARVRLAEGQELRLDFQLARAASIRGTALLPDGRPAVGAVVVASKQDSRPSPTHRLRATADADGRFAVEDLDAGAAYFVWGEIPGYAARAPAVAAGTESLVLKLREP